MDEHADHDGLFKELITTFFWEFVEAFLPEVAVYLDRSSLTPIASEIFNDVQAGFRYEADVLMRAKFKGEDTTFLIHLENQSTSQTNFNKRMFRYFARLGEIHDDEDIYPVALFSFDRPLRAEPHTYTIKFPNKRVVFFDFDVIQLNRLSWRRFVNKPNPVVSALMAKMKIKEQDRVAVKLACLKMLVGLDLDEARTFLISNFIGTYLRFKSPEEERKFEKELAKVPELNVRQEVREVMNEWMERGYNRGVLEGELNGQQKTVMTQVEYRFPQLTPSRRTQIQTLSPSALDDFSKALFDFSSLDDLTKWLDQHK